MTENVTYCDKHVSSRKCIFFVVENRLQAATRAARYQQALHRYHSHRVHTRSFEEGDLVLRHVQSAKGTHKLSPKWEGPY